MNRKIKKRTNHIEKACVEISGNLPVDESVLLRSIGLDAFVMLRFIQFGFDITFYPFVIACAVLIPMYYLNDYEANTGRYNMFATGYFAFTINRLEDSSKKLWVCWAYALLYRFYTWYRIWKEWKLFIPLRYEFLMKGDPEMDVELTLPSDQSNLNILDDAEEEQKGTFTRKPPVARWADHIDGSSQPGIHNQMAIRPQELKLLKAKDIAKLTKANGKYSANIPKKDKFVKHDQIKQFRNSCFIEFIPSEYRTNEKLHSFFDQLFPDQVVRTRIIVDNPKLTEYDTKRRKFIEVYERVDAMHHYAKERYDEKTSEMTIAEPQEPMIKVRKGCSRQKVQALPYYSRQIDELNDLADDELEKVILEEKIDDGRCFRELFGKHKSMGKLAVGNWASNTFESTIDSVLGKRKYASTTAFIEFKTMATAQSGKKL